MISMILVVFIFTLLFSVNGEVIRRKFNFGSDRAFIDNFDFIYPSQFVKKTISLIYGFNIGTGGVIKGVVWTLKIMTFFLMALAYSIVVIIQLLISVIISVIRLAKTKNWGVDGSFIIMFFMIQRLMVMPYVLSGGNQFWLNTYVLKLPTWLFYTLFYVP